MTGISALLKDYKEVATTTVAVANRDILPTKEVEISYSRPNGFAMPTSYRCVTRTRTESEPHFGYSTYLKGSANTDAEGQVRDL